MGSLSTEGRRDWRLPTIDDPKGIYEESKSNKMGAEILTLMNDAPLHLDRRFADGAAYGYWSSEEATSCCARIMNSARIF